ncbi:MAG: hypothetical protein MK102_02900 [Fuerstiella sp.]|nr:hypothetical protein [Fuerstiella sp.]
MSHKWIALIVCSLLTVSGCSSSEQYEDYSSAPLSENTNHDHHDHGAGVHGGQIIEFDAAHAHHAELVFDEKTRDITLYFYGAEIGKAQAAEGLVFEVDKADGDELHLDTSALPLEGETEETASRFLVAGSELPPEIRSAADLHCHFHVNLSGQEFTGHLTHDDHHDEHGDHAGHSEDDH